MATSLPTAEPEFEAALAAHALDLRRRPLSTLQVNLTKQCNQACRHCHVDASPKRSEHMDRRTAERVLALLEAHPGLRTLDLTGGAPELNPQFELLARGARALGRRVIVRHNLTVQLDPHPETGASLEHLPALFAELGLEVVSSLPYHARFFTDKQRGRGVFDKSLAALRRLNAVGYAAEGSPLVLTLVYNPAGAFLPAAQASLEADYRRALGALGLRFSNLITITNMPIHRFREDLERHGTYADYLERLVGAFNPRAAENVMCRDLVSVDHEGRLYDCDFNQMLGLAVGAPSAGAWTVFDLDLERLAEEPIRFGAHCFGCTAGAGSSCGGATA